MPTVDLVPELLKDTLQTRFSTQLASDGKLDWAQLQRKYIEQAVAAALCSKTLQSCREALLRLCNGVMAEKVHFADRLCLEVQDVLAVVAAPQCAPGPDAIRSMQLVLNGLEDAGSLIGLFGRFPVHGKAMVQTFERFCEDVQLRAEWVVCLKTTATTLSTLPAKGQEFGASIAELSSLSKLYHSADTARKMWLQENLPLEHHTFFKEEAQAINRAARLSVCHWLDCQMQIVDGGDFCAEDRAKVHGYFTDLLACTAKRVDDVQDAHQVLHGMCEWSKLDAILKSDVDSMDSDSAREVVELCEGLMQLQNAAESLGDLPTAEQQRFDKLRVWSTESLLPKLLRHVQSQVAKPLQGLHECFAICKVWAVCAHTQCSWPDHRWPTTTAGPPAVGQPLGGRRSSYRGQLGRPYHFGCEAQM